jgi:ribonuclease D
MPQNSNFVSCMLECARIKRRNFDAPMQIITQTAPLEALISRLTAEKHAFLAIDTEFERETTYWPQLCLIQLGTPMGEVYLIDPLAPDICLDALKDLLTSPDIIKVFHAARQDIEVLYHVFGVMVSPLFDTQIGAMLCGLGENIGYEALIQTLLGQSIDKSARMTNWLRRPLSEPQQLYAGNDVLYLVPAYLQMREMLEKHDRLGWADEETAKLLDIDLYEVDPQTAWERLNVRTQTPLQRLKLKRLAAWREAQARARNMPRSRLLKTDAMEEILHLSPKQEKDFDRVRSLKIRPLSAADRAVVLALIQTLPHEEDEALRAPFVRPTPAPSSVLNFLKLLLAFQAKTCQIAPALITSSKELEAFALDPVGTDPSFFKGWRDIIFGQKARDLLAGRLHAYLDGEDVLFAVHSG